jgi:hypothetical protein
MKAKHTTILMYGRDEHLLETRKWVLQSRGYRVLTMLDPSALAAIPLNPSIPLLLLCDSLSTQECEVAAALASARWPEIHCLVLDVEVGRAPAGLLGQLLHTMDGPAKLISIVSRIVGTGVPVAGAPRP